MIAWEPTIIGGILAVLFGGILAIVLEKQKIQNALSLERYGQGVALFTLLAGMIGMVRWYAASDVIPPLFWWFGPVNPMTALALLLLGATGFFLQTRHTRIAACYGAIVAIIGTLRLLDFFEIFPNQIDSTLFADAMLSAYAAPARMMLPSAIGFVCVGIGFAVSSSRTLRHLRIMQTVCIGVITMSVFAWIVTPTEGLLAAIFFILNGIFVYQVYESGMTSDATPLTLLPIALVMTLLLPVVLTIGVWKFATTTASADWVQRTILSSGAVFTLLLLGVVYALSTARRRAMGYAEDMTKELRHRGEELLQAKAKDDAIMQSIGDGLVVTDTEGKIVLVNKAFEQLLGWKEPEVLGALLYRKVPMMNAEGVLVQDTERPLRIALGGKTRSTQAGDSPTFYERKDGTRFPVAITVSPIQLEGRVIGAVAVFRDITQEKQARDSLEFEKQQFQSLSERFLLATRSAHVGVWDWDIQKNELVWDDEVYRIFGLEKSSSPRTFDAWEDIVFPDDQKKNREEIQAALRGEKDYDNVYRITWPDGAVHYIVSRAIVKRNAHDEPVRMIGVNWDVTKEKEIDKAKSEFVSLASHQLRTPLSAINWYTEMLLAGDAGKINTEQKEYLEAIYTGNQRMVDLVNALLNVSRLELGTFLIEAQPTDVVALAKSVLDELRPKYTEKQQVVEAVHDEIPLYSADPKLLRMVLQNLLTNAVKYTPEKGHVSLQLRIVKKGATVATVPARQDSLAIIVADTGYGIPKSQQEKIFSKMFRADNAREKEAEGSGLGLYIVKSVADQSGGQVWFTSEENKGTTFYILLPLSGMQKKKEAEKTD
jgi:PAS domain S-box-containing protein